MVFNKSSARYNAYYETLSTLSSVTKFMPLYIRRKMYIVSGARDEIFDLHKVRGATIQFPEWPCESKICLPVY
jgi:hypothetical protein